MMAQFAARYARHGGASAGASVRACTHAARLALTTRVAAPQVGDTLPDVTLFEGTPAGAVRLRDLFAGAFPTLLRARTHDS